MAEFARHLCSRLHFEDIDVPALLRGCEEAIGLGLAAVTCRPEYLERAAQRLDGTSVAVVTGLGFHRPSTITLTEQELCDEARLLVDRGASELAVIANAHRLKQNRDGNSPAFISALVALAARQQELGFPLCVHVEVSDLDAKQIKGLCGVLTAAGVWLVQAGSWQDPRVSYQQLLPMREALGDETLLKWTSPVRSVPVMLLAMSFGVDRFNPENVAEFLNEAKHQAHVEPLAIPLAGIDY